MSRTCGLLAHAFLTVITAADRAARPTANGLIPLTVNELRRLFDALLLHPTQDPYRLQRCGAWLGMVLGISFLETPLKFQTPGITLPLGLGIGRVVFRALNATEITLAAVLLAALLAYGPGFVGWVLLGISGALLATQTGLLRPRLDRRAGQMITGHTPPPSRLHLAYMALEFLKVAALVALGSQLITGQ